MGARHALSGTYPALCSASLAIVVVSAAVIGWAALPTASMGGDGSPAPHLSPQRAAAAGAAADAPFAAAHRTVLPGAGARAASPHECTSLVAEVGADAPEAAAVALPLRSGRTRRGSVGDGEYRRFQVCVRARHGHEHDVHLRLRALRGDADLYASATNPRLGLDSADWVAAGVGDDELRLSTALRDWPEGGSALHIAVYGRTDAEFELSANVTERGRAPPALRALRGGIPRKRTLRLKRWHREHAGGDSP